jgi:hypothetical protein
LRREDLGSVNGELAADFVCLLVIEPVEGDWGYFGGGSVSGVEA